MGLDFPIAPVIGQQHPFTPVPGEPVFIWDGEKWTAAPLTGAVRYDAAQSLSGSQQAQARENIAVDSSASGSIPAAPFDALAYNGMQINGSMEVSQEKGTATTTANGYVVDGVSVFAGLGIGVSVAQVIDAPPGYSNSVKLSVTTAKASLAATDEVDIFFPIEGYRASRLAFGTASAQPVSISFWSKIHRPGMYSGALNNGAYDRCYPFTFTQNVADAWEYKTVTASGDVTGTWNRTNGAGLFINFAVAGGSTMLGTAGVWVSGYKSGATGSTNGVAATSDTFQITGVIVLPGTQAPTAAQSPNIMRPYDQELVTCQRYFEWAPFQAQFYSHVVGEQLSTPIRWAAEKRAVPTTSAIVLDAAVGGGAVSGLTAVSVSWASIYGCGATAISNTTGNVYCVGHRFSADARL